MSKKKYELNNLVAIQTITDESTLDETYGVSMQIAAAEDEVKGKYGSVWSRLRYEVAKLCNAQLKLEGGDVSKVDYNVVGAKFTVALELTEQRMDASAKKRPAAWVNAKSQLKLGLEEGFPFLKHPEISQNKLRTAAAKLKEDREESARQLLIKKDAEKHGLSTVPPTDEGDADKGDESEGGDAGDVSAGKGGDKPNTSAGSTTSSTKAKDADVSVIVPDRKFKDPKLAAAATAFIIAMMDLEVTEGENKRGKTGSDVALSTVGSATNTLKDSLDAFQTAAAKLAEAS